MCLKNSQIVAFDNTQTTFKYNSGPLYLRIRKAGEEKAWTVLRKSDVLNNGASMWQTPDDKK